MTFGEVGFGDALPRACVGARDEGVISGWGLDAAIVKVFPRASSGLRSCSERGVIRAPQPQLAEYLPVGREVAKPRGETLPSVRLGAAVPLRAARGKLVRGLGAPSGDEMSAWAGALAPGGRAEVGSATRVNLPARHAILSQLRPVRVRTT